MLALPFIDFRNLFAGSEEGRTGSTRVLKQIDLRKLSWDGATGSRDERTVRQAKVVAGAYVSKQNVTNCEFGRRFTPPTIMHRAKG